MSHWVLDQLNFYIRSAYVNRVKHVALRQAGGGMMLVEPGIECAGRVHRAPASRPFVLVFTAVLLAIGALHAYSKIVEVNEEAEEDEVLLGQIDRVASGMPEVLPPTGLAGALRASWLGPLYFLLGGDRQQRPGMRAVLGVVRVRHRDRRADPWLLARDPSGA